MKYCHLFFDLDHTLWDFETNSRLTMYELYHRLHLAKRGVNDFELFHRNYLRHNEKLWERYRNRSIKVDELRLKRMQQALLDFKIADDQLARQMSIAFLELLPTRTAVFPGTMEILNYLMNKAYKLHLITNGFDATQRSKLKHSGLDQFFIEVVTSESSNCLKPQREIFEYAMNKVKCHASACIMLGDSIEVDILGAMNAGMDQVFVNHLHVLSEIKPTYTIGSLKELKDIF